MDDRTFHPFPRLPWELREEIWQFAAHQQLKRVGRIRYIQMDENRNLLPLGCGLNADDVGNESGYTWDSYVGLPGLWTACRHSYGAAKRFRNWSCTKCISCSEAFVCRRVFAQDSGDCQGIALRNDICCITSDSWESLLRPWRPIFFRTEDARGRRRTEKVLNIGIKFDPAWNEELEKTIDDTVLPVLRELSPQLAFVVRLLIQLAPRGYYEEPAIKLMLIDDVSKWQSFAVGGHGGRRISNGDQGYVELAPLTGSGCHVPVKDSPIDEFMDHLETSYLRRWVESSKSGRWESLSYSRFFCPLLRRENYIPGRPK